MKTKKLIQLIVILFITNSFSQNLNVEILLTNGETKKGEVNKNINFAKDVKLIENKKQKSIVKLEDIKTMTIITEYGNFLYESVKCFYKKKIEKKPRLMKVIQKGYLSLYSYENVIHIGAPYPGLGGGMQGINNSYIYGIREGEVAATMLSDVMQGQVNPNAYFRYHAPKYFSDHPEIAKKIEDKIYKYSDIYQVALEYNKWKK